MTWDCYCCKACKSIWRVSASRGAVVPCPECESRDVVNITWQRIRERSRALGLKRRLENEENERKRRELKKIEYRTREKKTRFSRGRYS